VKLITGLDLVPRSRMREALPLLNTPLCRGAQLNMETVKRKTCK
jgi:hypothetical protein